MKSRLKVLSNLTIAIIVAMVGLLYAFNATASTATPASKAPRAAKSVAVTKAKGREAGKTMVAPKLARMAPEMTAYQEFQRDSMMLETVPYINVTYTDEDVPSYSLDEFCDKAGAVIFKVNKTNIEPGNPFLNELRTNLLPLIKKQQLELYRIDVRGAASPEGPTDNNERLAIGRANILRDSITSILPSADGELIRMSSVTEDYELLIHYMEKAGDPDTELVRSLYKKWKKPADIKWALFTAKNSKLWPRLLKEYFPQLRATRVILYFHIAPDAVPVKPVVEEPSVEEPKTDKPIAVHECECKGQAECHCAAEGPECPCYQYYLDGVPCPCVLPDSYDTVSDTLIHRRPILAIGTNLIYDLWYMPDFGFAPMWNGRLEWYPYSKNNGFWNHTSLAIAFVNPYWHKWDKHKFYQIRNYEIEARWYHRYQQETGQRYGWYLGAAIENNIFGIGLSDTRGWQGEGLGTQITGGYVLPLDKCKSWKLEFNLGFGFYETHYDPYIYEDPYANYGGVHGEYNPPTVIPDESDKLHYYYKWYGAAKDFKLRQWRYRWIGPMQIGISIKYDFLWKRENRRGASFRHYEKRKEVRHE